MTTDSGFDQSITEALRLDRVCDRFESLAREGIFPPLEHFIGRSHDEAFRYKLLTELLQLEIEYRFRLNHAEGVEGLAERFPEHRKTINAAIAGQRLERATQELLSRVPTPDTHERR